MNGKQVIEDAKRFYHPGDTVAVTYSSRNSNEKVTLFFMNIDVDVQPLIRVRGFPYEVCEISRADVYIQKKKHREAKRKLNHIMDRVVEEERRRSLLLSGF